MRKKTKRIRSVPAAAFLLSALAFLAGCHQRSFLPQGKSSFLFQEPGLNSGQSIKVWTYLASGFTRQSPILFVLHGNRRNGSDYRDQWADIAERNKAILLVPEFSREDFPEDTDYNMGRMFEMDENDVPLAEIPEEDWSYSLIEPIFEFIRNRMGNQSQGYLLYGHSAGSQFVHRFIFFKPEARILKAVCANAGWYTLPDFHIRYPYGLMKTRADEESLRLSFRKKVVIYLGDADIDTTSSSLRRTSEAMEQGVHRFERGHFFFKKCQETADKLYMDFEWTLKIAPGVVHDNAQMAAFAEAALFRE